MSRISEILGKLNEQSSSEAGFDLTVISARLWSKLMDKIGASTTPENVDGMWVWKGKDVEIRTGNDPITGKYSRVGRRADEKNYASYIGINGSPSVVRAVYDYIIFNADNYKESSSTSSPWI